MLFWDFGSSTAVRSRSSFEILLLDVLGLGSLHQKHRDALFLAGLVLPDGFFGRSGVFLHAVAAAFSLDFVHSTVVAKRSHFAEVLSLVTVFWSLFLLMERDELGVSPSPHRMSRDSPLKGGQLPCHMVPCFRAS